MMSISLSTELVLKIKLSKSTIFVESGNETEGRAIVAAGRGLEVIAAVANGE
jgi:hypothetical protein